MIQILIDSMNRVPPELATIALAALPLGELRGALPVALTVYKLPIPQAFFLAILGNMLPVYFLMLFFERGSEWLMNKSKLAEKVLDRLFERTRVKLEKKVEKYGCWALALFVAIPLPVTGAWTGSLAAFVFGIPKHKVLLSIFLGLLVSATIVTILTMGVSFTIRALLD